MTKLYEKLSFMDSEVAETKATKILLGLGFKMKQLTEPISSLR